jgi:hypothetical protein
VVREREGRTIPALFKSESAALGLIASRVATGTEIVADEASSWNDLQARYDMQRIDHQAAYSDRGVYSDGVESIFSRMRRAEICLPVIDPLRCGSQPRRPSPDPA